MTIDAYDKEILKKALSLLNEGEEISTGELQDASDAIAETCADAARSFFKDADDAEEAGLRVAEMISFVPAHFKEDK